MVILTAVVILTAPAVHSGKIISTIMPQNLAKFATRLLPVTRDPGETGILLLALSRYIGDSAVINHFCGLV